MVVKYVEQRKLQLQKNDVTEIDDRIHVDYLGPFKGELILNLADAHTGQSAKATETIRVMRIPFSKFGLPKLTLSSCPMTSIFGQIALVFVIFTVQCMVDQKGVRSIEGYCDALRTSGSAWITCWCSSDQSLAQPTSWNIEILQMLQGTLYGFEVFLGEGNPKSPSVGVDLERNSWKRST